MTDIGSLPDEIVELILSVKSLGCGDVCRFGQCCKKFNCLIKDENLWRRKAKERWKVWTNDVEVYESFSWQKVYRRRHQMENYIKDQFNSLQQETWLKSTVSEDDFGFMDVCLNMFEEDSYLFLNDTIQDILRGTDCSKNLTEKYFAEKMNVFLSRLMCKKDLHVYLENPERTSELEEGATLIGKWMYPVAEISIDKIKNKLDDIANMVRAKLAMKEGQKLTSNSDKSVQLEAINAVKHVVFDQLKFRGNKDDYYNLSNSYIHKVLETKFGIPISLSILFQSIAKRIGLTVEPVNCPGHFLVRWKYFDSSTNELKYHYIDCFNNGVFLDHREFPHSLSHGPVPHPREVLKRMMLNIIHILQTEMERTQLQDVVDQLFCISVNFNPLSARYSDCLFRTCDVPVVPTTAERQITPKKGSIESLSHALDLFMILVPDQVEMVRLNARVKLYLGVQLTEVIKSLENLFTKQLTHHSEDVRLLEIARKQTQSLREKKKAPRQKLRSDPINVEVSLKVGMIMHHRRFDYRCVVYGWDPVCKMSEEWIAQMGVDNLSNGRNQPFYNVLVSDGTNRYASQESLGPEPQIQMITHAEVGRYFKEFTGNMYIPNVQLQNAYPEDLQ